MTPPIKHPVSESPVQSTAPTQTPHIAPRRCQKPVKVNPFECHRDPTTGRWITIQLHSERSAVAEVSRVKPLVKPVEIATPSQPELMGGAKDAVAAPRMLKRLQDISHSALVNLEIGRRLNRFATAAATAATAVTAFWVMAH
ncbi:MAG TPA: hypothetical protein V6C57_09055 [Coleofasciculaceae cyanobacterium]